MATNTISKVLEHFRFAHPECLYLLLLLPLFLLLRGRVGTHSSITFSNLAILQALGQKPRLLWRRITASLLPLSLIFATLSLARPQWRTKYSSRAASGVDITIALDISVSMETSDFILNRRRTMRIDAARETVKNFIKSRPNDRIGIISFAGRPYFEGAITLDHQFLLDKLDSIRPDRYIYDDGTAIGSAISAAASNLQKYPDTKTRIILLITDGSSNSGKIDPIPAAELAAKAGIKVYTIAIGTPSGRLGRNTQAYPQQEFDTKTLEEIAKITKADYFRAQSSEDLERSFSSIDQLEKTTRTLRELSHKEEFHHYFSLAAAITALLTLFFSIARPPALPE